MRTVRVGDFKVGQANPPFFVAELGICHGGSVETALELTRAAAEAGAHCVKTETFQRSQLVFDPAAVTRYTINGETYTQPLAEHMEKYQLSFDEHHQVKLLCDRLGLPFMSTAHDFRAVDFLVEIGAAAIKIASPDIIHYPLLRHVAQKGLPVFLDTGAAFQYEVELAVKTLRESGCEDIVVNHNPEGHPAPADRHDLNIIRRLKQILGVPVGLADHYEGYEMVYAAVAVGACTVEKPISQDRFVCEPERNYSISIEDLPGVIRTMNRVYQSLGRWERDLSAVQNQYRNNNRVACAAAKDLPEGSEVNLDNIVFGRPRRGIGAEYWDLIAGRRLRRAKRKHEFIQWRDLD